MSLHPDAIKVQIKVNLTYDEFIAWRKECGLDVSFADPTYEGYRLVTASFDPQESEYATIFKLRFGV
jgi:hypothetical protein